MENPIKMDDLGVPLFSETSICLPVPQPRWEFSRRKVIVRNTFIHVETEETTKMDRALAKRKTSNMRWFLVDSCWINKDLNLSPFFIFFLEIIIDGPCSFFLDHLDSLDQKNSPCFMRNKQPGIFPSPLRSSKTTTTAGGSRKRASSAPPEYQTHKEPCGLRKQELITRWFGWWFFWNGFHVWDEVDMFRWWGRLGNHRPGFSLEMFMEVHGASCCCKRLCSALNQQRSKQKHRESTKKLGNLVKRKGVAKRSTGGCRDDYMHGDGKHPWISLIFCRTPGRRSELKVFPYFRGESPDVSTFMAANLVVDFFDLGGVIAGTHHNFGEYLQPWTSEVDSMSLKPWIPRNLHMDPPLHSRKKVADQPDLSLVAMQRLQIQAKKRSRCTDCTDCTDYEQGHDLTEKLGVCGWHPTTVYMILAKKHLIIISILIINTDYQLYYYYHN